MNLVPHNHQTPPKRSTPDWMLEKGRKYEPFDSGKVNGDQRSVARALRMDRKR
jgi:hypothetical protein